MSNLLDIKQQENKFKEDVIAALFDGAITAAFSGMNFVKRGSKWVSKYHLDGTIDSQGKNITSVAEEAKFNVHDSARNENKGIIDLYMMQNGLSYSEARKRLSELTRVPLPQGSSESRAIDPQQASRRQAAEAFKAALWSGSDEAQQALEYLHTSRNYDDEVIKAMGLGLINKSIQGRLEGCAKEECNYFGNGVRIAIPIPVGDNLVGFKFRSIDTGSSKDKYINSKGLRKGEALCGMRRGLDTIVIVESELDALHAQAAGMENVVATAGGAITKRQLTDARARGAKQFVLLFDNDERGAQFTEDTIKIINDDSSVKVANLPIDYKDLDEYLSKNSVASLKAHVAKAVPAFVYMYQGYIAEKEIEQFTQYGEQQQRERQRQAAIAETVEKLSSLNEQGRYNEIVSLMSERGKELNLTSNEEEFARVFSPPTEGEYYASFRTLNKGLPVGINFTTPQGGQEALTINVGLSFVCGSTGHGKSSFLNNVALNEAERNIKLNNGKKVLYFSYEISKEQLTIDLLNTYANLPNISHNPHKTIEGYLQADEGERFKYFKGGNNNPHCSEFATKEKAFYNNFIKPGNLKIVAQRYTVEKLISGLLYEIGNNDVSLVCIDYAQLMYSEQGGRQRTEEIKKVVNDLKDFANEYKLPILLAAQFNREVASPVSLSTSNIGEGGDFERIADTIIGIFNLERVEPIVISNKPKEADEAVKLLQKHLQKKNIMIGKFEPVQGQIYLRLLKRRNGVSGGDVVLDWCGKTKKITLNDEAALNADATQAALFDEDDEANNTIDF